MSDYFNIPAELRELQQWVCWTEEKGRKLLKIARGKCATNAKSNDRSTWRSFEEALACSKHASGIGFVFSEEDPYIGIDMDNKEGSEEIDADHQLWIKQLSSYTERSPSGTGYHVILKGDPIKGFNSSPYEGYSQGRYFTFTGDVVLDVPIAENKRALKDFVKTFSGSEKESFQMPEAVESGNRNDTMFRLACSMLSRGMEKEDVSTLIYGFNRGLKKPLQAAEVRQLLDSAGGYDYEEGDENIYEWLLENLVWVAGQNAYWDHSQRGMMSPESVNRSYLSQMPEIEDDKGNVKRIPPAAFLTANEDQKVVYDLGWHPTKGEIFEWESQTRLNTYLPGNIQPVKGDTKVWQKHLSWLIPDESIRNQVLDWLAFTIQNPGEKINYGLFIGGPERVGKDMLLEPIVQALGEHNCKEISAPELHDQWTEYLFQTKLLIVGEMHTKFAQQRTVENHLKRLLAGTATQSLVVNDKNLRKFRIPNLVSVIFMSNHRDALVITGDNAARYLCVWCDVKRKPDAYYEDLGGWMDELNNVCAVYHLLMSRDLSNFNPKGNAQINEYTKEVVAMSKDSLEAEILMRIEDVAPPFNKNLVTTDDICAGLAIDVITNRMRVNKIMRKLGYESQKHVGRIAGKVVSRSIFVVRAGETYNEMSEKGLLDQYFKQRKA